MDGAADGVDGGAASGASAADGAASLAGAASAAGGAAGGAADDLALRDRAWRAFVAPEDRRAFAADAWVQLRHPLTGAPVGEPYRVLGDPEFAASAGRALEGCFPRLSREEWARVLCAGACRAHGPGRAQARCRWSSPWPELCAAEALQLHPQASRLSGKNR